MSKYYYLSNVTLVYLFNTSFVTFLALIFFISGFQDISIEISVMQSYMAFITLALSSHSRSIIVSDSNMYKILSEYSFRLKVAIIILLSVLIFFYNFINKENFYFIFGISILLLSQWIFELNIAKAEITKDKKFIFKNGIYIIFFLLIFSISYLNEYYKIYEYLVVIILIYILFQILKNSFLILFVKNKIKDKLYISFKELSVISSSSLFFVNFLWKILIIFWYGKIFAATLFVIFSLSSFISTAYNNSFGFTFLKNQQRFFGLFVFYLMVIIFLVLNVDIFEIYIPEGIDFLYQPIQFFKDTIIYSFIGSCFMLIGQFFRSVVLFEKIKFRKLIFITDIIYSLALISFLFLIKFISGPEYLKFLFLISGFINFILYFLIKIYFKNLKSNKKIYFN